MMRKVILLGFVSLGMMVGHALAADEIVPPATRAPKPRDGNAIDGLAWRQHGLRIVVAQPAGQDVNGVPLRRQCKGKVRQHLAGGRMIGMEIAVEEDQAQGVQRRGRFASDRARSMPRERQAQLRAIRFAGKDRLCCQRRWSRVAMVSDPFRMVRLGCRSQCTSRFPEFDAHFLCGEYPGPLPVRSVKAAATAWSRHSVERGNVCTGKSNPGR